MSVVVISFGGEQWYVDERARVYRAEDKAVPFNSSLGKKMRENIL